MSSSRTPESLESRRRRWWTRACANCWRSRAALYSEFSRRSPCARAFSISLGRTKEISWFSRSTSDWSFCLSASIIPGILTDEPPNRLALGADAHLPPADRSRPVGSARPDRRPEAPGGGALSRGQADRGGDERQRWRGKELRDGERGESPCPRWSQCGCAGRRLEWPHDSGAAADRSERAPPPACRRPRRCEMHLHGTVPRCGRSPGVHRSGRRELRVAGGDGSLGTAGVSGDVEWGDLDVLL